MPCPLVINLKSMLDKLTSLFWWSENGLDFLQTSYGPRAPINGNLLARLYLNLFCLFVGRFDEWIAYRSESLRQKNSESLRQIILEMTRLLFFLFPFILLFCCFFSLFQLYSYDICLLYTSPSPRDQRGSRMPSSA